MASEDVGTLVARIVADQEQFRSEMLKVTRQMESNTARMNKSLASVDKALGGLSTGFSAVTRVAAAFGVALSARAIIGFVDRTISAAAELHNLSVRLNASVESLSELQYVAKITDVDFGTLTKSMQIMTRTVGDAVTGGKAARETFSGLGLDLNAMAKLTIDQQFIAVADALNRIEDESVRAAMAQKIFGRGGVELLQITEGGAAAINKLIQELRDMGGVLSTDTAARADEAKDALDRMNTAVAALGRSLIDKLATPLATTSTALQQFFFPTEQDQLTSGLEDANDEVARLEASIVRLSNVRPTPATRGWLTAEIERTKAELREAQEDVLEWSDRVQEARQRFMRPTSAATAAAGAAGEPAKQPSVFPSAAEMGFKRMTETPALEELPTEQHAKEQERQQAMAKRMEEWVEMQKTMSDAGISEYARYENAMAEAGMRQIQLEQQTQDQIMAIRTIAMEGAVGLLQALGSEHRGAAIAALALQKFMAIKQIFLSGQVEARAASAAAAIYSPLDPTAGPRAFARVMLATKIQMGLVAATGLVQAAQLSSGGSSPTSSTAGSTANPIATRAAPGAAAMATSTRQGVVEVHVGNLYGWDEHVKRQLVGAIKEAVEGKDVILFGRNSRQAQIMRAP